MLLRDEKFELYHSYEPWAIVASQEIPKEPELGTYSMPKLPFMMLLVQISCNLEISNFQLEEKAEGIYFAHHHQNSYHQQTDS
ncbi:hypothetical protein AB3S75_029302 [Citrus x aurantiifolia]